jgi:serine/threonine protein kinase
MVRRPSFMIWDCYCHQTYPSPWQPIKEISAMQLIGNYHPNVLGCLDVLQDDDFLYTVMPYCSGGDLYGRLMGSQKKLSEIENYAKNIPGCHVDERQARIWFRQLLSVGLLTFPRHGTPNYVSHTTQYLLLHQNNRASFIYNEKEYATAT